MTPPTRGVVLDTTPKNWPTFSEIISTISNVRSSKSVDIGGGKSDVLVCNSIEVGGTGRRERRQQRDQDSGRAAGEGGIDTGKHFSITEGPEKSGVKKVANVGAERKDPSKAQ